MEYAFHLECFACTTNDAKTGKSTAWKLDDRRMLLLLLLLSVCEVAAKPDHSRYIRISINRAPSRMAWHRVCINWCCLFECLLASAPRPHPSSFGLRRISWRQRAQRTAHTTLRPMCGSFRNCLNMWCNNKIVCMGFLYL